MRIDIAADVAPAAAFVSSAGAVASSFGDLSLQLLGVPLPVLLAAAAGAWIARAYTPAGNFFAAAVATFGWTIAGCVLAPLAAWAIGYWSGKQMPNNVQAGLALVVSVALPLVLPVIREKLPAIVSAALERLQKMAGGGKGGGDA